MVSRFCIVAFCLALILIITVYLRGEDNRDFYLLCTLNAEQGRLKQELTNKQLEVESLLNPSSVSQHIDK